MCERNIWRERERETETIFCVSFLKKKKMVLDLITTSHTDIVLLSKGEKVHYTIRYSVVINHIKIDNNAFS